MPPKDDEEKLITFEPCAHYNIVIRGKSGALTLKCDEDKFDVECTGEMTELAKVFFYELLAPMVDGYLKDKINAPKG